MIYMEKSRPAPECLAVEKKKKSGTCDCGAPGDKWRNVRLRLEMDFKNKCYLCENEAPIPGDIEHFVPCGKDKDLKFDWNNLFFSCAHCNSVKGARFNNRYSNDPKYILNCSVKEDGVDASIKYECEGDVFERAKVKFTPLRNDEKVLNTIELLEAIYKAVDGTTRQIRAARNLRKKLLKEVNKFKYVVGKYAKNNEKYTNVIKRSLASEKPFTAFKRWIVRDNEALNRKFKDFLKD